MGEEKYVLLLHVTRDILGSGFLFVCVSEISAKKEVRLRSICGGKLCVSCRSVTLVWSSETSSCFLCLSVQCATFSRMFFFF